MHGSYWVIIGIIAVLLVIGVLYATGVFDKGTKEDYRVIIEIDPSEVPSKTVTADSTKIRPRVSGTVTTESSQSPYTLPQKPPVDSGTLGALPIDPYAPFEAPVPDAFIDSKPAAKPIAAVPETTYEEKPFPAPIAAPSVAATDGSVAPVVTPTKPEKPDVSELVHRFKGIQRGFNEHVTRVDNKYSEMTGSLDSKLKLKVEVRIKRERVSRNAVTGALDKITGILNSSEMTTEQVEALVSDFEKAVESNRKLYDAVMKYYALVSKISSDTKPDTKPGTKPDTQAIDKYTALNKEYTALNEKRDAQYKTMQEDISPSLKTKFKVRVSKERRVRGLIETYISKILGELSSGKSLAAVQSHVNVLEKTVATRDNAYNAVVAFHKENAVPSKPSSTEPTKEPAKEPTKEPAKVTVSSTDEKDADDMYKKYVNIKSLFVKRVVGFDKKYAEKRSKVNKIKLLKALAINYSKEHAARASVIKALDKLLSNLSLKKSVAAAKPLEDAYKKAAAAHQKAIDTISSYYAKHVK